VDGPIRTVGVVGAGTMGSGIAQLALEAGHTVLLHDVDRAAVDGAITRIRHGLARRAARLDLDADAIDDWVEGRLAGVAAANGLDRLARRSDLVVEAALEDLETKRALFAELDRDARPATILATNTSALSVAAIAAATTRPERVAGLHFFNPAPLMRLVEVVATPATDPEVTDALAMLMTAWDRTPVRSADAPGFIVNRVNRPFTLEPLAALEAGEVMVAAVDRAARAASYPMGPFELIDLIGLDVNLAVTTALYDAAIAADDPLAERFRPSALLARMVASGRLGRKSGGGFGAGSATTGTRALAADGDLDAPLDPEAVDVIDRTTLAIIDEAYRALGDGVADVPDIDVALRLGAGHPLGPFERADRLGGAVAVLARLEALRDRGPRFVPAPVLLDVARPS
jgi:3-hydroxybutyryl-CoA dehydrogenase